MFLGIIIPSTYIYMWLLLSLAMLFLTIGILLELFNGIKYIWSRLL